MLEALSLCKNSRLLVTVKRFVRLVGWLDVAGAGYRRFPAEHWDCMSLEQH